MQSNPPGRFPVDTFRRYTVTFDTTYSLSRINNKFTFQPLIQANLNDVSRIDISACDLIVEHEEAAPEDVDGTIYLYWAGVETGFASQPSAGNPSNWNRVGFAYSWSKTLPLGDGTYKNPRNLYKPVAKNQFVHSNSDLKPLTEPVLIIRNKDQLEPQAGTDNVLSWQASFLIIETRKNPPVAQDPVLLGTVPSWIYSPNRY